MVILDRYIKRVPFYVSISMILMLLFFLAIFMGCGDKEAGEPSPAYDQDSMGVDGDSIEASITAGRYEEAIEKINGYLLMRPYSAPSYALRALCFHRLGQYEESLDDNNRAIALDPTLVKAYIGRGLDYIELGFPSDQNYFEKALADFNKALELDPSNAEALCCRGKAYFNLRRFEEAIADCDRVIAMQRELFEAYSTRGKAYSLLYVASGDEEQLEKAIADLEKALEIDGSAWYLRMILRDLGVEGY